MALDTLSICRYKEHHVPSNFSSLGHKGSARPKQGLKPHSVQWGPYTNSLEETIMFLEMTGHSFCSNCFHQDTWKISVLHWVRGWAKVHLKTTQNLCIRSFKKISFRPWDGTGTWALSSWGGPPHGHESVSPRWWPGFLLGHSSGCRVLHSELTPFPPSPQTLRRQESHRKDKGFAAAS